MKRYVLGFALNADAETVLLIKKNKPTWQAGKYNGIGGHVEEGEIEIRAMIREFEEETGIKSKLDDWKFYATMHGPGWTCRCYKSLTIDISTAESKTDEKVQIVQWQELHTMDIVSNLIWLVHMAVDNCNASSDSSYYAEITYQ